MGLEIERKYLVLTDKLPTLRDGTVIRQAYLSTGTFNSVRARIRASRAFLTIKGESDTEGLSRQEFEYEIPLEDARQIIDGICDGGTVEKTRYLIPFGALVWEVDVFTGANEGLVMAEVELPRIDFNPDPPPWVGRELTGDPRFYNMNLARNPWSEWSEKPDI